MTSHPFITKVEKHFIGIDDLMKSFQPASPYGLSHLSNRTPFKSGQEAEASEEYDRLQTIEKELGDGLLSVLHLIKPLPQIRHSISLLQSNRILGVVDLFEIKKFLYHYRILYGHLLSYPHTMAISNLTTLEEPWKILDPHQHGSYYFRIDSDYAAEILQKIDRIQKKIGHRMRQRAAEVKKQFDLDMTQTRECVLQRNDSRKDALLKSGLIALKKESSFAIVIQLLGDEETRLLTQKLEEWESALAQEEKRYIGEVSSALAVHANEILAQLAQIGILDFRLTSLMWKDRWDCCYPTIHTRSPMKVTQGRSILMEDICAKEYRDYDTLNITIAQGVTLITGANMGGKTETLKAIGQWAYLCSMGIPVPASAFSAGLFQCIRTIDRAKEEDGLSGFGTEISKVVDALTHIDGMLLLIDEFGSTTQPSEGEVLALSLGRYLQKAQKVSVVFVTHFSKLIPYFDTVYYTGVLKGRLPDNIRPNELSRQIDHRLRPLESQQLPQVAFAIAKALGLPAEIIEDAYQQIHRKENHHVRPEESR